MRIATWNVNSARTRIDRIVDFMARSDCDLLALQEIKCKPEQFPSEPLESAGYHLVTHGLNQWNGVAFVSKVPFSQVETSFPGQPTWQDQLEARALGVTVDTAERPFTFWSLYVPNGRELDDPHYQYKLEWLAALDRAAGEWLAQDPDRLLAMGGDWNIAPQDEDVWDPEFFVGKTHTSVAEREAFAAFQATGYQELTRPYVTNYTYWDYQKLRFPKNEGMRIDFIYGSPALAQRVEGASIDRNERKGKGASDHVPVIVDWRDN